MYMLIVGNKVKGTSSSLARIKTMADETERKYRVNCFIAKEMSR